MGDGDFLTQPGIQQLGLDASAVAEPGEQGSTSPHIEAASNKEDFDDEI